jgi:hypothetical protein
MRVDIAFPLVAPLSRHTRQRPSEEVDPWTLTEKPDVISSSA